MSVYLVNYRGSTGFGQDSILSLIGQIGSQDVKDVQVLAEPESGVCRWKSCAQFDPSVFTQRAVLTALQTDISLDSKRLAVIGGSHGGFLSCHLVGQYPEFYRACAVRNPVINAATLLGTSDIVDWWDTWMHASTRQHSATHPNLLSSLCLQALHQCRVSVLIWPDTHSWSYGCHVREVTHRTCCSGQTHTDFKYSLLWSFFKQNVFLFVNLWSCPNADTGETRVWNAY